jgi:hypothetical protein
MSSHVSPMRATILIPEPRDAAPLHSARATNAAAYHLYLNVTRLLERCRTEEERIERHQAVVPRLHAFTHSPTSDLWSVRD